MRKEEAEKYASTILDIPINKNESSVRGRGRDEDCRNSRGTLTQMVAREKDEDESCVLYSGEEDRDMQMGLRRGFEKSVSSSWASSSCQVTGLH